MDYRQTLMITAFLLITRTESANILLMPVFHSSHVNFFSVIGTTLQKAGHNVKVLTISEHTKAAFRHGLDVLVPKIPKRELISADDTRATLFNSKQYPWKITFDIVKSARLYCIDLMNNTEATMMLEREKFDLVLVDGLDVIRCQYMIPYKIGVPYITVMVRHEPWKVRMPALPSIEPYLSFSAFDEEPSFFERLTNLVGYCIHYLILPPSEVVDHSLIRKYIPDKPKKTFHELFIESEMWIVNQDTVCLDYPRIQGIHYQFLGGLGLEMTLELTPDWQDFIEGAEQGLIIVTFGSALKNIPLDILEKMLEAFVRVPQRVAMRYDGPKPARQPSNVRLAKWLPQNDLLAQNVTKLFITHSGNNGQLEALHHAVPMLGIPIFGDQLYNARRAAANGFGLYLDIFSFTSDDLYNLVIEIIGNPVYKENIARCSAVFHSLPNPQESLAFWVDHVLKFGESHLKPKYIGMSFWKFWMLDILLFIVVLTVCILYGIKWCCKIVLKKCFGTKRY